MKNIISRRPNFKFSSEIPKFWLGNSIFKTHLLNSFTLIFPAGERFFIRSISKYMNDIQSEELKKQIREFLKQEAQHANEHEKFFKNLNQQGYEIDLILTKIDHVISKVFEPRLSPKMCLAITAGLEHFTALIAEIGLKENFLNEAHPIMKELFEWHAAEEIEHRSVAYDVLQYVDSSYSLRLFGLIIAYILLVSFSGGSTLYLINKDRSLLDLDFFKDVSDTLIIKEQLFIKSLKICLAYVRPEFHPSENDLDYLSKNIFENNFLGQVA